MTSKLLNNKRGQFLEVVVGVVFVFVFVIVSLFVFTVGDQINDDIQDIEIMTNESRQINEDVTSAFPSIFDSIAALIFVILWIVALVAAFNSNGNLLWIIVAIVVIAVVAFSGMVFSNVWDEFEDNASTSQYTESFPLTDFILSNYLIFVVVMTFSVLIVIMTRSGGGL